MNIDCLCASDSYGWIRADFLFTKEIEEIRGG